MSETWIRALILVCTFGAVALLVEQLLSWSARSRFANRAVNARVRMIAQGYSTEDSLNFLRRSPELIAGQLPSFLIPIGRKFERMLTAAQIRIPTSTIFLLSVMVPLGLFLFVSALLYFTGRALSFGNIVLIAAFAIAAGLVLPLMLIQAKANRTRKKMQAQFPLALDVFVRGLRAGHPVAAALDLLTAEMTDPIGSEFGIVVDEVTYGADMRDALQAMADRWDLEELRMFVVSLSVQNETGGNLAEILDNLASVIRDRASLFMKVRALSSEGRMSAWMLSILPVGAFSILFLSSPSFYLDVSDDPMFVPGFLGLVLLYSIGFYAIRRMIDLKV
jgi:tight adherence protein B